MFTSLKSKLALGVAAGAAVASNASAALTAADVNMSSATGDMAIVFIAILGVLVIGFGYRMIKKQIG